MCTKLIARLPAFCRSDPLEQGDDLMTPRTGRLVSTKIQYCTHEVPVYRIYTVCDYAVLFYAVALHTPVHYGAGYGTTR